jgi:Family of unknown function (DUF6328)
MSEDSEAAPERLDDERDREELRDRYYGLMQELRVILPGVQVLVAFLLTVPFAARFRTLDDVDRGFYGAALVTGILSVVAMITPAAMHRFGDRRERGLRLQVSIVMTRIGLLLLGVSMTLSLLVVSRLLFSTVVTWIVVSVVVVAIVVLWLVVPLSTRRR